MAEAKRYYRKNVELFLLLDKIKLWPSRSGMLHGIRNVDLRGDMAIITTHCGKTFEVYNSRNSRAARWLRNKWVSHPCPKCRVPEWKLEKYSKTFFEQSYGSDLKAPVKGPAIGNTSSVTATPCHLPLKEKANPTGADGNE